MKVGTPALWDLAEAFGVVPAPPDEALARLLAGWWAAPRLFGCVSASRQPSWTVVAPDLRVWCEQCARERFAQERRCVYCGDDVRLRRSAVLAFEMSGGVRVLARAHAACANRKEAP